MSHFENGQRQYKSLLYQTERGQLGYQPLVLHHPTILLAGVEGVSPSLSNKSSGLMTEITKVIFLCPSQRAGFIWAGPMSSVISRGWAFHRHPDNVNWQGSDSHSYLNKQRFPPFSLLSLVLWRMTKSLLMMLCKDWVPRVTLVACRYWVADRIERICKSHKISKTALSDVYKDSIDVVGYTCTQTFWGFMTNNNI